MRNRLGALVVAALAVVPVAACGFQSGPGGSGAAHVVIALQFTPAAGFALETDDAYVLSRVGCLETLVRYDQATAELLPELATAWDRVESNVWEFTLRDDVTFQNGTQMTATEVADALDHALQVDAPARAFTPDDVADVAALDEQTVRITTAGASPLLPYRLASPNTGILAPEAYQADTGTDVLGTCTGPFQVTSYSANQAMTMQRYPDYWGQTPELASVEARFVPEGETRANQLRSGEAQIGLEIPSTSVLTLENDTNLDVTHESTPRTTALYLNNDREPFDDVRVRRAVQAALDLSLIADTVFEGGAQPAIGPFAPDEVWAPDEQPVPQDLDAARELLAEAGYGPGDLSLTLYGYVERAEFADLAAVIQANLASIGINVAVSVPEYAALEPSLLSGDYDMALMSRNHLADIPDPAGYLEADYTCDGGFNISHFCDPEFDALVQRARTEDDADRRAEIYAEAAAFLQENVVSVFIVHEQISAATAVEIDGFSDDPLNRYAITPDLRVSEQ